MRYIFVTVFFMLFSTGLYAQKLTYGPKVNIGTGYIKSSNLKSYFSSKDASDSLVTDWKAKSKFGQNYGFGMVFQLKSNDPRIALVGEITYNGFYGKIKTTYKHSNVNAFYTGTITTIDSDADVKYGYLAIPIMMKYMFGGTYGPFVIGGLDINLTNTPTLTSTEIQKEQIFDMGVQLSNEVTDRKSATVKLDVFGKARLNLLIGGGTSFPLLGRTGFIELRYHFPVTKSEMYTTDPTFEANTLRNNEIFGLAGKTDVETNNKSYKFDDFKAGILQFSFGLRLFKS